MKKPVLYLLLAAVLFTSCATASLSKYRGVGRIKQYDFTVMTFRRHSTDSVSALHPIFIMKVVLHASVLTMRYVHYNL